MIAISLVRAVDEKLMAACEIGDNRSIVEHLKNGGDASFVDPKTKLTPLMLASKHPDTKSPHTILAAVIRRFEESEKLISDYVNHQEAHKGWSALHFMANAEVQDEEALKDKRANLSRLMLAGANVSLRDKSNNTAILYSNDEMTSDLLSRHINHNPEKPVPPNSTPNQPSGPGQSGRRKTHDTRLTQG